MPKPTRLPNPFSFTHRSVARHWRSAALLCAGSLLWSGGVANAANAVSTPVSNRGLELHLRPFASVTGTGGAILRLNTIVSVNGALIVSAEEGQVFEVADGSSTLLFDFAAMWPAATGRSLDFGTSWHSGLRGIAFSPNFATDGKLYTSVMEKRPENPSNHHYLSNPSDPIGADSVVSEWTVVNGALDTDSYRELFRVGMPVYDHPIKDLAFGPDGLLYITHGDASVQSATAGGGMNNDALGKVLRISPTPSGAVAYTVPSDNPFVGDDSMIDEVWTLGHRNPHTLAFTDDGTLILGEVGRDNVDEINVIERGNNYGWPAREGTFVHLEDGGIITGVETLPANDPDFGYTYPVAQFGHEGNVGAGFVGQALTGGIAVENGSPLDGEYLYGEFATVGDIYHISLADVNAAVTQGPPSALQQATPALANIYFDHDSDPATEAQLKASFNDVIDDAPSWTGALTLGKVRSDMRFGEGPAGEVYVSSKRNGIIYLITSTLVGGPGGFTGASGFSGGGLVGGVEAETGSPVGLSTISAEHAGFSGTGYVDNIRGDGSGVEGIGITTSAPVIGALTIAYSAGPDGPAGERSVGVYVNGIRQAQASFISTGTWTSWATTDVNVALGVGLNEISFIVDSAEGDTGWVNVDAISIEGATEGSATLAHGIQAESGTPVGRAAVDGTHLGFSGTGYIGEIIGDGAGVQGINVTSANPGVQALTIGYAMGAHGPAGERSLGVYVNGVRQAQATFTSTGAWDSWSTTTVSVELDAGLNTIGFVVDSAEGDTGWINLDAIDVNGANHAAGGITDGIEAESGTPVGRAAVDGTHLGFSGTGYIGEIIGDGAGVRGINVTSPNGGVQALTIGYAMGAHGPAGERSLGVYVNGVRQAQATFTSTGAWDSWSTTTVSVELGAGLNSISFVVDSAEGDTGWVNIDAVGGAFSAFDGLLGVEAESGTPAGGGAIEDNHSGFSGTGFIGQIIGDGAGVQDIAIDTESAGTHTLTIAYAMGTDGPAGERSLGVYVNGVRQAQATFTSTCSWSQWSTSDVAIRLDAGVNTIDLLVETAAGDTGWINIDTIATSAANGVAAESGLPLGLSTISAQHTGFSGTGYIDNIRGAGSGVEGLNVAAASAGLHSLNLLYAIGAQGPVGERSVGVYVNGIRQAQATFATTGGWSTWATEHVDINLELGANAIDLVLDPTQGDTGWINIDEVVSYLRNTTACDAADADVAFELKEGSAASATRAPTEEASNLAPLTDGSGCSLATHSWTGGAFGRWLAYLCAVAALLRRRQRARG